jgi:hypothetical protein
MPAALSVRAHLHLEALEARQMRDAKLTALPVVPTAPPLHIHYGGAPTARVGAFRAVALAQGTGYPGFPSGAT